MRKEVNEIYGMKINWISIIAIGLMLDRVFILFFSGSLAKLNITKSQDILMRLGNGLIFTETEFVGTQV